MLSLRATASSPCRACRWRTCAIRPAPARAATSGFVGYLDGHDGELDEACLRRAMGYGTVLASFNVERFGTERVAALSREEIEERLSQLHGMTQFEPLPAAS